MEFLSIFLIAIGLSFDTFAVSVSSGLAKKEIEFWTATRIAFSLAFFQTLMPLIGWGIGYKVKDFISAFDHWIAFILLTLLGAKMCWESLKKNEEEKAFDPLKFWVLIGISIATSIDALVVGISFGFIDIPLILTLATIGSVTFIVSMLGMLFGKKAANLGSKKFEFLGGLILFGIGLKILLQHSYFAG